MNRYLALFGAIGALFGLFAVATPADEDTVDLGEAKARFVVVTDGKGHYLAFEPFKTDYLFYGDGKTFWQQRVFGGGGTIGESYDWNFWETRASARRRNWFALKDGKYTVSCDERRTDFAALAPAEQKALFEKASFQKPKWKHQAYALARDSRGTYYYVDKLREPEGNRNFRLFVGPRGNVKLQKMTNIVSDSAGDIFSTKNGELRLVLDRGDSRWIQGKAETKLTSLPIEENVPLIYMELGPYTGQKFGTPCDDM